MSVNEYGVWTVVLERVLAGLDGNAYVVDRTDDDYLEYPLVNNRSQAEQDTLAADLKSVVGGQTTLYETRAGSNPDIRFGLVTTLGKVNLAVTLPLEDYGVDIVLSVPTKWFTSSMFLCDLALVALVGCSIILFVRYMRRVIRREPYQEDEEKKRIRELRGHTSSGLAIMCTVTCVACVMLFMLEGMATTANTAMSQRDAIQYERDHNVSQREATFDAYAERYVTRANAVAQLLSDNPGMRTREDLMRLSDIVGADYLMLFDAKGTELFAGNAYVNFTLSDDPEDATYELRPILKGYSHVETQPARNPVTGRYEHYVASLVTGAEGMPDGFVLLVTDDEALMAYADAVSLADTVNSFSTQEDEQAAVVDEDGLFVAHTDASKIGERAEDYFDGSILGHDFEGFTHYDGRYVYVSSVYASDITTMVIVRSQTTGVTLVESCVLVAIYLIGLIAVFFTFATSLVAKEKTLAPVRGSRKVKAGPHLLPWLRRVLRGTGRPCLRRVGQRRLEGVRLRLRPAVDQRGARLLGVGGGLRLRGDPDRRVSSCACF